MHKITRSLVLMALMTAAAPHFAVAQDSSGIGPNASEPGAVAPTTTPMTPAEPAAPAQPVTPAEPAPTASATPATDDASAPKPAKQRLKLGVDYTIYMPTNGHTRDRFGGNWSSFGIGIGGVGERGSHSLWAPEFNFIYQKKDDNQAFMVPFGISYRYYQDTKGSAKPYIGASAGGNVVTLQSNSDNIRSGTNVGGYGSIFIGSSFTDNFYVEARYYSMSKERSFDLSGLSLSTGIRF